MTDSQREKVFAALAELSRRYPTWRVGQLVANVADWADTELWDLENDQLLAVVQEHLAAFPERHSEKPVSDSRKVI